MCSLVSIENLSRVWDNGTVTPDSLSVDEILRFKNETGARTVVGSKWTYRETEYETPFYVRLLADQSGIVHFANDDLQTGCIVIRNGDLSERAFITVPSVDTNSRPEKGCLNLPPSSAHFGGIEWGCEGNDGFTDYLFDFDWKTGALLRYARPTRPW